MTTITAQMLHEAFQAACPFTARPWAEASQSQDVRASYERIAMYLNQALANPDAPKCVAMGCFAFASQRLLKKEHAICEACAAEMAMMNSENEAIFGFEGETEEGAHESR